MKLRDYYDIEFRQKKRYKHRVEIDKEVWHAFNKRWAIKRINPQGKKVLDLGCGKGFLPVFFNWTLLHEFDYLGIDSKSYNVAFSNMLFKMYGTGFKAVYGDLNKDFYFEDIDQIWMIGLYVRGFAGDYNHLFNQIAKFLKGDMYFDVPVTDSRDKYTKKLLTMDLIKEIARKHDWKMEVEELERPAYEFRKIGSKAVYKYLGVKFSV